MKCAEHISLEVFLLHVSCSRRIQSIGGKKLKCSTSYFSCDYGQNVVLPSCSILSPLAVQSILDLAHLYMKKEKMFIQILFVFYATRMEEVLTIIVTEWSPCSRECGSGIKMRYIIHNTIGYGRMNEEHEECVIDTCESGLDGTVSECISNNYDTVQLYQRGIQPSPMFPALNSNYYMYGMTLDVYAEKRPFTIHSIYFLRTFSEVKFRYKTLDNMTEWLDFPIHGHIQTFQLIEQGQYLPRKIQFLSRLEAMAIQIIPIMPPDQAFLSFQANIYGCHLASPVIFDFYPSIYIELTNPLTEIKTETAICSVLYRPYYFKHMHIVEVSKGYKIGTDPTQIMYTTVLVKNKIYYSGENVIQLTINITSIQELESATSCMDVNGTTRCLGIFDCLGKVDEENGKTFGNFDKSSIELLVEYDTNECSTLDVLCSPDATCVNTKGSYYCSCVPPTIGDGYSCYTKLDYIEKAVGFYSTLMFKEYNVPGTMPILETYCRGLLFNNVTSELFVCQSIISFNSSIGGSSGCVVSTNKGNTWNAFHPRIDIIQGFDSSTGDTYGYSNLDQTYVMYRVEDKTWYSIPKVFYTRIKKSELFCNDKVLLPTCQITADPRRLESTHPLEQSQLDTDYGKFAATTTGVVKSTSESKWEETLSWDTLPIKKQ